jgi:hypothetical protein
MPTIYDKLEAKIRYHEDRANAYRITLEDLRADDTKRAKTALPENLSKAIQIRRSTNGAVSADERLALIETCLRDASAPLKVGQIVDWLRTRGVTQTRDQVAKALKRTTRVKRTGKFSGTRYTHTGAKPAGTTRRTAKATPTKGALRDAALGVLSHAKAPLLKQDFRARIEERLGRKIGAAGFGSLVRYGYAKLTSEGYVGTGKAAPEE